MKKKVGSLVEMHPLTINIDNIFNMPANSKIVPSVDENGNPT